MTDLRTALTDAAGPKVLVVDPTADLSRARRALRRHRVRQLGVGAGATAALAGCAVALAVSLPGAAAPTSTTPEALPPASGPVSAGLTLVANTTAEPSGFGLAVIPQGWTVAYDTASAFVLAPAGTTVAEPRNTMDLSDRIAVRLQAEGGVAPVPGARTPEGPVTVVTVAGRPAALVHDDGSWIAGLPADEFLSPSGRAEAENERVARLGAPTLWIRQPDETYLVVQAPTAGTLSDQQIVELAEGITVKPGAVAGNG